MSNSDRKYPKGVKSIHVAGRGGEAGRDIEVDSSEASSASNVSKQYRDYDREIRALCLAGSKFFSTYLELHTAANEETKDGSLKHFGKNTIKAHKAALKVLKNNSKVFDYDPSEVHDNVLEYIEDLEEEYENDEE